MAMVEAHGVTHRYGALQALADVDLELPAGAVFALLGPNGAGKTTLLQVLMGLRRPTEGRVELLGRSPWELAPADRAAIGYVAESQRLPRWMTIGKLEAYLAPLYPSWDDDLVADLRRRFDLDPGRRIGTLSRGEYMKTAVLCALAPRPRLVLMDEPFTGMDALVKDELVRALLESSGEGARTVLVASHDIGELEPLADRVGILVRGRLVVSEPMDTLRERFRCVEVVGRNGAVELPAEVESAALSMDRSGARTTFLLPAAPADDKVVRRWFPAAARVAVRPAPLRDVFIAITRADRAAAGEAS